MVELHCQIQMKREKKKLSINKIKTKDKVNNFFLFGIAKIDLFIMWNYFWRNNFINQYQHNFYYWNYEIELLLYEIIIYSQSKIPQKNDILL